MGRPVEEWVGYYIGRMTNGNSISLFERFVRFAGVGVIGTGVHYLVLIILVQGFGLGAVMSTNVGALAGALVNYVLNYHYTFQSAKPHHEALSKFMVVAAIAVVLNGLIMYGLTTMLGLYYLLAQVITTGLVLLWTFFANHHWSFRE
ncbi:MAG: GtrA family protein [Oceanisphaera sp.]|nr:GtrA family protein [Oceanisphaera sp.]